VFTDWSKVGRPHREVAVLNSRGDNNMTSESGMINSQRAHILAEPGASATRWTNARSR